MVREDAMTDRILNQLIQLNIIDSEDVEIYRFGLEGLSLKLIHYTSYLAIAFFAQEMTRFLIFFASFLILRKSAGGYHAKTRGRCYISSCFIVFCMMICIKMVTDWNYEASVGCILLLLSDFCIFAFAPLGNRNREYDAEETLLFRKRTVGLLILENTLVIILWFVGKVNYIMPIVLAIGVEALLLLLEKIRIMKVDGNGI